MAGELKAPGGENTIYGVITLKDQFWNGSTLADYLSASFSSYAVSLSRVGDTQIHMGNFPTAITTAGTYDIEYFVRAGDTPAESDTKIAAGSVGWNGSRMVTSSTATSNRTALLRTSYQTGQNVKAVIFKGATVGNGTTFETFTSANYANYLVSVPELGSSGIYMADLPDWITAQDLYEIFFLIGTDEAAPIIGVSSFVFSSTASVAVTVSGAMSGTDLYAYFLRTFKRTNKETEFYDALTDTVQELMRRFSFDETTELATVTDTIDTLGDWRLAFNPDLGLLTGDVILLDGGNSFPLSKLSNSDYDRWYPYQDFTSAERGTPSVWTYRSGQIWIGPVPSSTSYSYRVAQSRRLTEPITSATVTVPFSGTYRELLRAGCLHRVFEGVEAFDKSEYWRSKFEVLYQEAETREMRNRATPSFTRSSFCLPGA